METNGGVDKTQLWWLVVNFLGNCVNI